MNVLIGSETDCHFEVSSGDIDASVTFAVGVGLTDDGLRSDADDFDCVVIPEDESAASSFVINDVPDDVAVGVDATVHLTVGRSQTLRVVEALEPAGGSVCFLRSDSVSNTENRGCDDSASEDVFEVEHSCLFEVCLVECPRARLREGVAPSRRL